MWRRAALALVLVAAGTLSACSVPRYGGPEVVASFYPLQYVAQRVLGGHDRVLNLTKPGVEPHDIELSPVQAAKLSGAKVVFYEKGLAPAVDEAVANEGPEHVVDIDTVVHLRSSKEDHGQQDPHFWQDPTLLAKAADAFTREMSRVEPAHAAAFRANNAGLQRDLHTLDTEYEEGLRTCRTRSLVVSHDAFEYLGRRYHLDVHPIAGLSPDAEPSAKHLAELGDLIRTDHITTVFNERLASPQLADTLAHDLHLRTEVLDPIEGLTSSDSHDDYLSLMRANLAALRKAGTCS